ncbi:transmembrane protein 19-like [Lytechinus pictus]|uniref:transmembrane protein 19-like n=1 Tax=Lytechinus pictus TaxID=7653 RepID=UPI0030BA00D6
MSFPREGLMRNHSEFDSKGARFFRMVIVAATALIVVPFALTLWWISLISFTYYGYEGPVYPISPLRWLIAVCVPLYMSIDALNRKKLDRAGAVLAFVIGVVMTLSSYSHFLSMAAFFYSGSKLTRFRARRKQELEEDYKEGGQRTWIQVFANGGLPALYAAHFILDTGFQDRPLDFSHYYNSTFIALGVMSGIACCSGDTWASEVGSVVGMEKPFLITTWERVPRGTNGGVSLVGTLMSFAGGLVVGLGYLVGIFLTFSQEMLRDSPPQWPVVLFGGVAGLVGSLFDSLLGAWFQYSGYCTRQCKVVHQASPTTKHISGVALFDNEGINLLSCLLTVLVMPHICFSYWPRISY